MGSNKRKAKNQTSQPVNKKIKTTLIDDQIALKIFREIDVTDKFLNEGKLLAWAVQPDDPAYINIHDYVARSQDHQYGIKVLTILRIIPQANTLEGEEALPLDFSEDPNATGKLRMMLWHGTKQNYLQSILGNGLKIPTHNGQMFGSGIYFADRASKSANYCFQKAKGKGHAYMLLCDVLLGKMKTYTSARPDLKYLSSHDSVKGVGMKAPDKGWDTTIDGCVWPLGPTVRQTGPRQASILRFNEYVVYDTKQVQPKYLVKVEFTAAPVHEKLY